MTAERAKEHAPWYISAIMAATTLAREFLREEAVCVVHSIEDLEAIVKIAQGFSG